MRKILFLVFTFACFTAFSQNREALIKLREAEGSSVLLNNSKAILPLKNLQDLKIASLDLGFENSAAFDSIANKYTLVKAFRADTVSSVAGLNALHDKLKLYNLVFLKCSDNSKFGLNMYNFFKDLEGQTNIIIVFSGKGQTLGHFKKFASPILWNKNAGPEVATTMAQIIFGGVPAHATLDADYSTFRMGSGFSTQQVRLGFSVPEAVSVSSTDLNKIDGLVKVAIAAHSSPGAVILVAKDGQVIFNRAYGSHTYNGTELTKLDDIFDLASVTKVTATTPSVMRLYDQKLIGLDTLISKYVASTRTIPDKSDIKIKEALLHEAGYYPYIKFFEQLKPGDMSTDSSAAYPTKVADNYFLRANYFEEVMWPVTLKSKGDSRGKFVYSDISMYMLKEVVEQVTHKRLNEYVRDEFYRPLGMQTTGFLPRNRFDKSRIVPTTENDNWFRNMLVQGYVNDPGSAMAGGVEGHAGLFSNANDLAIYYQMLLNKGAYGGDKYFDPATVELFTSRQSKVSPRGYGFARLTEAEEKANKGYPSQLAFGHSGYTGTYVWVDPKYNLVYICLTNRVYPDDNKTYGVSAINLRAKALDLVYEAIIKADNK
jgi:CubicO group peptidase (beta-lactamase class C family)